MKISSRSRSRRRAGSRRSARGRWALRLAVAAALAVVVGYVPYRAYGPSGLGRAIRMRAELDAVTRRIGALNRENARLRRAIARLRRDRGALERVARDELGLVGEHDIVFQFE